ncbi:MAG: hypothetical protein ACC657_00600 [Thiohalomonadales bacterium]
MKNIITATIEFNFKGETFTPSITIDLNEHVLSNNYFPDLCALIATANNIDHYSYEYEMMQAQKIKFSNAIGFVENFVEGNELNIENFTSAWHDKIVKEKLVLIAESYMDVKDLSQHPDLENALLEAYNLGKKEGL